jgi:hypothetical protein
MILVNFFFFVSSSYKSQSQGSQPGSLSTIGGLLPSTVGLSLLNMAKPGFFGAFLFDIKKLEMQ